MNTKTIAHGVVHKIPNDMRSCILATQQIADIWQSLTPLARNEWICWIESAKKSETRERRTRIMQDKLMQGILA